MRHRLALALEVSGVSVAEMAEHLGASTNTVGNYTSGRTNPKRPTLVLWAMKTGAPLEWIMTGIDPTDPEAEKAPTSEGGGKESRLRDLNSRPLHYKWHGSPQKQFAETHLAPVTALRA